MINDARAISSVSPAFHIRKVKWKSRGGRTRRSATETPKINRPKTMGPADECSCDVGLGGTASSRGLKFAFVPPPLTLPSSLHPAAPGPLINHSAGTLARRTSLSAVHEPRRCVLRGPDIVTETRYMCTTVGALLFRDGPAPSASAAGRGDVGCSNHGTHTTDTNARPEFA